MTDSRPTSADDPDPGSDSDDPSGPDRDASPPGDVASSPSDDDSASDAELRARVEEKYDFDDFGPGDMAEMTPEEWDAAFDEGTWITGDELLERVRTDLERRVAHRDVFAVVERREVDGDDAVLAFSDEGYAVVKRDGSVEGFGTVLRDVKPTVALCSMDSYEPEEPPAGAVLPDPEEVPEGSGELGNFMLQLIAGVLGLSGVVLLGAAVFAPGAAGTGEIGRGLMIVFGLLFLAATFVLFFTVANARLSDKFRAEEYRERLRAIGLEDGERPAFLPTEDDEATVETALDGPAADRPDASESASERTDGTDPAGTGQPDAERDGDESSNPTT
ncbi:DUF308 domain-containing protein [Halorubellus sp. PRR65]|uniref:DUF308 domain-containing protein n=1 Tax=Halorubellus sp. PRR65 TaxID=3098148 RepID=UPI002B257B30|nr:DUF308 domain-containing protein [Halorubellus sp. PRR65]